MATKNPGIDFRVRLLGAAQMAREARDSGKALTQLGTDTEKAGHKAQASERGWGIFQRSAKRTEKQALRTRHGLHKLAGGLAGLGVGFEAAHLGKESIDSTKELAEATLNLSNAQGLSTRAAGQWAAVAQVKGIGQAKLAQNFGQLAKNIELARGQHQTYTRTLQSSGDVEAKQLALRQSTQRQLANVSDTAAGRLRRQQILQTYAQKRAAITAASTKAQGKVSAAGAGKQAAAFRQLGITQKDLARAGTDMSPIMLKLAAGFTDMHGGAVKNNLALQLFGRGWKNLLPLFKEGNESLQTNLKWARQYGVALGGETPEQMKKFLVAQDKAKYATLGLQVAFGSKLAPALVKIIDAWPRLVNNIRHGNGVWGTARTVIGGVISPIGTVVGWFQKSKVATDALGVSLGVLGVAWGVDKVVKMVRAMKELWLMEKIGAAASWGWRTAMKRNAEAAAVTAGETTAAKYSEQLAMDMGPAVGAKRGLFSRLGGRMGRWMGVGAIGALSVYVGSRLPKLTADLLRKVANFIHPGSVRKHPPSQSSITSTVRDSLAGIPADQQRRLGKTTLPTDTHFNPRGGAHPQAGRAPAGQTGKPGTIPFFAHYGSRKRILDYARHASPADLHELQAELNHFHRPINVGAHARTATLTGSNGGDLHIHLQADGRELAKVVVPHFRNPRIRGRVGQAAIGYDLDTAAFGG